MLTGETRIGHRIVGGAPDAVPGAGVVVTEMAPFGTLYLTVSYDATRAALSDPRFSRAASFHGPASRLNGSMGVWGTDGVEGPAHRWIRREAAVAMTSTALRRVRAVVTGRADALVTEMRRAGPPADLVAGLAVPLAVSVAAEVYGVPIADPAALRGWIDVLVSVDELPADQIRDAEAGISGLALRAVLRARPGPDDAGLVPRLLRVLGTGSAARRHIAHLLVMLVVAAVENPVTSLGTIAVALLPDRGLVTSLRADPDRLPAVVDELLRLYPPGLMGFARVANRDVDLAGVPIPAGATVVPLLALANRDPARFADPAQLVPGRADGPDLSFGWGPHSCIGAQLGRLQLQAAIDALVRHLPNVRLAVAPRDVPIRGGHIVDGYERVPVCWDRPAAT